MKDRRVVGRFEDVDILEEDEIKNICFHTG